MYKSRKRDNYLSSKAIFKSSIQFLLFRYKELTASQIQTKTGLKRQTTYNYLKEMEEDGNIKVRYDKVEDQPNVNIAVYSLKHQSIPGGDNELLSEKIRKESCKSQEAMIERIKKSIDANIGALLEIKAAFEHLTTEAAAAFVRCDPVAWGFYGFTYLLTDDEYRELITEFKKLIDRLDNKWKEKQEKDMHSGNVFTFTFYRTIPDS
ncbi:MAG: hypothetical protein ACXAEU_03770 [Candidatus Hodarchaeales archaeon]|jgi:DNA-binding Lrp family transcriptional regulator